MAVAMTPYDIARALSQDRIQVYYSFFGSPCMAVSGPRGTLDTYLYDIAITTLRAYNNQRMVASQYANNAMDYVIIKFAMVKIQSLYEFADQHIEIANIITRIFIAIRAFIASCFDACGCYNSLRLSCMHAGESNAVIPLALTRSDLLFASLAANYTPINFGFNGDEAVYSPEHITDIYRRYLAQNEATA